MAEVVTLNNLKIGQSAVITEIAIEDAVFKRRIQDMGFVKGEVITILNVAPLGDPVEIAIKDYRVAVRKRDLGKMKGIVILKQKDIERHC